jgi:hypothetical protein
MISPVNFFESVLGFYLTVTTRGFDCCIAPKTFYKEVDLSVKLCDNGFTVKQLEREMTTLSEKQEWDLQCYGMSEAALLNVIEQDVGSKITGDYAMLVASFMSNAQEEIEHGMVEQARQTLNMAKFTLFNYIMKDE